MIMELTAFFRSGILLLREFRGGTVSVPDLRRKEKHVKKRIFSFLLAVLMLAALLPTAAFADESTRKAVRSRAVIFMWIWKRAKSWTAMILSRR